MEQVLHEPGDPLVREAVAAAGPAVLRGLPGHQRAQGGRVTLVVHVPHVVVVPPQLALLGERRPGELRRPLAQSAQVHLVPLVDVHDRGRVPAGGLRREGSLALHQVVELPDGEPARPQQLPGVPGEPGPVHHSLGVGDAEADGSPDPGRRPLEREEGGRFAAFPYDRDPHPAPAAADRERELGGEEGVAQLGRALQMRLGLHRRPRRPVGGAELAGAVHADVHVSQSAFASCGRAAAAP